MAGVWKGRINVQLTTAVSARNANEMYISLYNFMEILKVAGYVNRVSLYHGSLGNGMDFWDGANPPGNGSFVVYQFPPFGTRTWSWYLLIQWGHGSGAIDDGNGAPALIDGGTGASGSNLGIQAAVAFDSGGNSVSPWGGTTNNNGTDSKTDPVWATPVGGSLTVLPRYNNSRGDYDTSKQSLAALYTASTITTDDTTRLHFLADRDAILMFADPTDNVSYNICMISPYTPANGLVVPSPLLMLSTPAAPTNSTVYGTRTASTTTGGVTTPENRVVSAGICTGDLCVGTEQSPNQQFVASTYPRETPEVFAIEDGEFMGYLGTISSFQFTGNVAANTTFDTYAYVVIGSNTTTAMKVVAPWDGVTSNPAAAGTRNGIDF